MDDPTAKTGDRIELGDRVCSVFEGTNLRPCRRLDRDIGGGVIYCCSSYSIVSQSGQWTKKRLNGGNKSEFVLQDKGVVHSVPHLDGVLMNTEIVTTDICAANCMMMNR